MANRVEYIKIAKIDQDGNDLTTTLESLTQITIPYTSGASPAVYPIESITRYNNYFLYKVGMANRTPDPNDSGSLEYNFTSSLTSSIGTSLGAGDYIVDLLTTSGTPLNVETITKDFFPTSINSNKKVTQVNTYPQKPIAVRISGSATGLGSSGNSPFNLYVDGNGMGAIATLSNSGTTNFDVTISIPTSSQSPGMNIYPLFNLYGGNSVGFTFAEGTTMFITSSVASGPIKETIPEPYLTSVFYGGDCDVLLNNVELYPENPFLQDLDYSTNPNVPVNFDLVLNGIAARGTVPESYYTSLAQTRIRYTGVKNQSSNFNVYNPLARGTDFGDNVNIGTYGQTPSISSLDANIYEFEWGGGTTPEIVGYGAVKMGRILQVSSKDLVKTINASDGASNLIVPSKQGHSQATARNYRQVEGLYPPESVNTMSVDTNHFWLTTQSISDYYQILNGNNPVNTEISMYMYPNSTAGSNPTLPSATKILNTEWGVPTISNYALTSSFTQSLVSASATVKNYGWIRNGNPNIYLYREQHVSRVKTDANGFYNGGLKIKPNWSTLGNEINKDLNNGEKWFVTLFNEFEFPNGEGDYNSALSSGSLTPYNVGFTEKDSSGNYSSAFAFKGVFEILGTDDTNENYFYILTDQTFTENRNIGGNSTANTPLAPFHTLGSFTGPSLGMLIWKARATGKNEFVIVQDSITGGVQGGAFTNRYAPDYITENFEEITKEYGSNQTG